MQITRLFVVGVGGGDEHTPHTLFIYDENFINKFIGKYKREKQACM